jgi:hypothetical protein
MKKSDLAMIILIASVSVMIAYFAGTAILGNKRNDAVKVKTADPISASVDDPSPTIFNSKAINPTVEVTIGGNGKSQATP